MKLALWKRSLAYVRPQSDRLALVTLIGVAATAGGLAQPYLSKLILDQALLRGDWPRLVELSCWLLGLSAAQYALGAVSSYQYTLASARILFTMRVDLFRHLQRLSPRFWAARPLGDVVSRLNNDLGEVQRITADGLLAIPSQLVFLLGSAALMMFLSSKLFLLSLVMLPPAVWAYHAFQRRLAARIRLTRERSASIGSFLIEALLGVKLVATARAEERETERFRQRNESFLDALLRMQLAGFAAGAWPGLLLTISTSALVLYGGRLVIDGDLSVGTLAAFLAYYLRLLAPVQGLLALYGNLVAGGVSLERVFELFDAAPEVVESPSAQPPAAVLGEIEFRNVTFRQERGNTVLNNLSFRVPPGAVCALVGPSGSGKSTVADLLLRFFDPDEGEIRLDGQDLRSLPLGSLRASIAFVEQTPFFFQATVEENLRYLRPEATREAIERAARRAGIHDFIAALPGGYGTALGERAQSLSAGERQRLAIARALVTGAPVLVLDEPTSALDETAEQHLCSTLRTALAGRTALIITHRPALRALAPQVVELA